MANSVQGTLVRFTRKQFGIIQPDDGSLTVWAHWTKLPEDAQEGDVYEFRVGNGLKGNFAFEIRKIETKPDKEKVSSRKNNQEGRENRSVRPSLRKAKG